ncbi:MULTISPECIES: heat shock protein transcriptional repressor HspR [Georgenia]|uniref:MerR family transcriptional regulator n=2 Tax=Georgenia TaxID=154116 RepID=A0A7J9UWI6_9MICO|nr:MULTISPECIES: MerR family transcriptional regulator [Georgenia]KAE8765220.1 MerR family transcriptional regulator [Georgenia thermotolerans]MPV88989.1 MerR family transcriptional regulator [Georgenia ruanii]
MALQAGGREDAPILTVSAAAELAGMHPQTLRQYDRLGIVEPQRTRGRGRRYTLRDVALLREVQRLSQEEGINLAGIKRILDLQRELAQVRSELDNLRSVVDPGHRVFAAGPTGDVVALPRGTRVRRVTTTNGGALVLWRPREY